jgi:hypothetical protein
MNPAAIYSYSKSKGAFVGVTLEGTLILTRKKTNRSFYGRKITAEELLQGKIPRPTAAEPLYRMLNIRFGNLAGQSIETITDNSNENLPPVIPSKKPLKYTALYDFKAQQNGDLSISEGDELWIISDHGDWLKGSLNGKIGMVPKNYVCFK